MRRSLSTLAVVLFLSVVSSIADLPKHSAITPEPRGDDSWKERSKRLNANVKKTQDTQLLFIGDSITEGWEGAGKEIWAERYAQHNAVNLGIGGDRTQHVLYRLLNGNLDGIAPKAAVVMIGTNNSNRYDNTAKQIAQGVGEIVKTLRSSVPDTNVLLLGIFPRGENINEQRGKLLQINQILAKHDDGDKVRFVDIGHHFITEEGLIPSAIMPDYLHLSPKGYEIWADAIAPHLRSLMGETGEENLAVSPLFGEWIFIIEGPDGNDGEMPLSITLDEGQITGAFQLSDDRQLPIKNAKFEGEVIQFTATRNRPNGGFMTYKMQGTLKEDRLTGTVTTKMEGQEIVQTWKARRAK